MHALAGLGTERLRLDPAARELAEGTGRHEEGCRARGLVERPGRAAAQVEDERPRAVERLQNLLQGRRRARHERGNPDHRFAVDALGRGGRRSPARPHDVERAMARLSVTHDREMNAAARLARELRLELPERHAPRERAVDLLDDVVASDSGRGGRAARDGRHDDREAEAPREDDPRVEDLPLLLRGFERRERGHLVRRNVLGERIHRFRHARERTLKERLQLGRLDVVRPDEPEDLGEEAEGAIEGFLAFLVLLVRAHAGEDDEQSEEERGGGGDGEDAGLAHRGMIRGP